MQCKKLKIDTFVCLLEDIHFQPWFILFKKEKNIDIKTKENMQQNTEGRLFKRSLT